MEYLTHNNYYRAYKVKVTDNKVDVFFHTGNELYTPLFSYNPERIFIGKSPLNSMTSFSGGHGPAFDGNSVLLHIEDDKYVYIGHVIYEFRSQNKIIDYISPVGNNCVPYPYAIDCEGKHFMLLEYSTIEKVIDEPNDYYYDAIVMSKCPPNFTEQMYKSDFKEFYVDENRYILRLPEKDNFDNIISMYRGKPSVVMEDGDNQRIPLTEELLHRAVTKFRQKTGIYPFEIKLIHDY